MNTVAIFCLMALAGACSALNCHTCSASDRSDDCWTWPQSVQVTGNCSACMTSRVTTERGSDALTRSCWTSAADECTETNAEYFGTSIHTTCCFRDLCNNRAPLSGSMMSGSSFREHVSLSALLLAVFFIHL